MSKKRRASKPVTKEVASKKPKATTRPRKAATSLIKTAAVPAGSPSVLVVPGDLVDELSGGGGEPFANFMHRLIKAEAARHGIHATDIDWDSNVPRKDGGVDLFIKKAHQDSNPRFIPQSASIWSFKAGNDGTKAATLRSELTHKAHGHLLAHLQRGNAYVWCALQGAGQNERSKMELERDKLASRHNFNPANVFFRWNDTLASALEWHLNLVYRYLPRLAKRLEGVLTLQQWMRESPDRRGFTVKWVGFSGRDLTKQRVQSHLLGTDGPAVLHIAGLSGIGKTRTAIQACLDDDRLDGTLCVKYENLKNGKFLQQVEYPGRYIRMIVDEVSIAEHQYLAGRFEDFGDRVRLVTVGPKRRREPCPPSVLALEEPTTEQGVLRVVQEAAPDLPEDVQNSIARHSHHDLRLALRLVEAASVNPAFKNMPICNLDDIWDRVVSMYENSLGKVTSFSRLYDVLTTVIDIGRTGDRRAELEYLAQHFGVQSQELDRAIYAAHEAALGLQTAQFFEAVPRGLAAWVFAERLWGTLEPTVDEFLSKIPNDRLLRRFVERCQEVQGPRREEVLDRIGRFFLNFLGPPKLTRLTERETSRVFEAWSELDPERGLPWLVSAAEQTTDQELRLFEGSSDWSGGWRGRRQIVWLCEHLACFKEHYWNCERVLFRLAQVETDESIVNNSRNTWKAMFLPVLSNTEVPFPERWTHLLQRLHDAYDTHLDLVLSAIMGAFDHLGGRMSPPEVVGGRNVPDEWRPRTQSELREHKRDAARQFLHAVRQLRHDFALRCMLTVVDNLTDFAYLDVFDELRTACKIAMSDPVFVRRLRAQLDSAISWEESNREAPWPLIHPLREWRAALDTSDLREQVIDLTSREYWSIYHNHRRKKNEEPDRVYGDLAPGVVRDLSLLVSLGDWFHSEECRSGLQFGFEVGKVDQHSRVAPLVLSWLRSLHAVNFAIGYLRGVTDRLGGPLPDAIAVLDELAHREPSLAITLSIDIDRSTRGFERVLDCLNRLGPAQWGLLRSLVWHDWPELLDLNQKRRLLELLEEFGQKGDTSAISMAVTLLAGWTVHQKQPIPKSLAPISLRLLGAATEGTDQLDDYEWRVIAEALIVEYPDHILDLLADVLSDVELRRYQRRQYAEELFHRFAGDHPAAAMQAIGRRILDKTRRTVFRMWEFRGIFDRIGLDTVRPWVQEHGVTAALHIARHLLGPSIDADGKPIVPPLADWLLTDFQGHEKVLGEFLMGRHSGEIRHGNARDRRESVENLTKPFRIHPKSWLREWAKYEMDQLEWEIKLDDQHEDEIGRT